MTGMPQSEASLPSVAKPSGEPAPRCAMITGFFAAASITAACCTSAAGADACTGCMMPARSSESAGHNSHSTSRGSAKIHRPLRRRRRNRVGAVDQLQRLLRKSQFVVPLAGLAHQRGLVAHLLAPADRHRAAAEPAALRRWRAAREHDDRNVLGRGVDRADRAVGEARHWYAPSRPARDPTRDSSRAPSPSPRSHVE